MDILDESSRTNVTRDPKKEEVLTSWLVGIDAAKIARSPFLDNFRIADQAGRCSPPLRA
jgi:hypothetical protein